MSANTQALKTAIESEVATIEDTLARAEAQVLCDRYIAAVESQSQMESGAVASYSIAGRTVTRRNAAEGQALIDSLRNAVYGYIRGNVSYVGMGGWA